MTLSISDNLMLSLTYRLRSVQLLRGIVVGQLDVIGVSPTISGKTTAVGKGQTICGLDSGPLESCTRLGADALHKHPQNARVFAQTKDCFDLQCETFITHPPL